MDMHIAYVDPVGGAAGDMLLAALLDAGAQLEPVAEQLGRLGVAGLKIQQKKEMRQFLQATRLEVHADDRQPHRHLSDIIRMIEAAKLSARATDQATRTFEALAQAEAKVHGIEISQVHFHEVGAADSIADVVGVVLALEQLGVERLECAPLPVAGGTIQGEHGTIPLPAPATLALAEARGAAIVGRSGSGELVTPTAAALLTTLAERFGPMPALEVQAVGYGAGKRTNPVGAPPNVTRVVLGKTTETDSAGHVLVLETNIDDQSPEQTAFLAETLREAGALDVFLTPVHMKKGRPGVLLTAIVAQERAGLVEDRLLVEGSTLGVRRRTELRAVLPRSIESVETEFGVVRVKVARRPDGRRTAAPEYEDCATRAREGSVPLRAVYEAALRAWEQA